MNKRYFNEEQILHAVETICLSNIMLTKLEQLQGTRFDVRETKRGLKMAIDGLTKQLDLQVLLKDLGLTDKLFFAIDSQYPEFIKRIFSLPLDKKELLVKLLELADNKYDSTLDALGIIQEVPDDETLEQVKSKESFIRYCEKMDYGKFKKIAQIVQVADSVNEVKLNSLLITAKQLK